MAKVGEKVFVRAFSTHFTNHPPPSLPKKLQNCRLKVSESGGGGRRERARGRGSEGDREREEIEFAAVTKQARKLMPTFHFLPLPSPFFHSTVPSFPSLSLITHQALTKRFSNTLSLPPPPPLALRSHPLLHPLVEQGFLSFWDPLILWHWACRRKEHLVFKASINVVFTMTHSESLCNPLLRFVATHGRLETPCSEKETFSAAQIFLPSSPCCLKEPLPIPRVRGCSTQGGGGGRGRRWRRCLSPGAAI